MRGVLGPRQHAGVLVGQCEAAGLGGGVGVVDVEEAGDGLLLEPLARVARRDAGAARELAGGQRPALVERAVQAELDAEVDGAELERAERRAEEALGEGVGAISDDGHGRERGDPALRSGYRGPTG